MKIQEKAEALLQEEELAEKRSAEFCAKIKVIYTKFLENQEELTQSNFADLKEILLNPVSEVDIDTYISIMYMIGSYYDVDGNRNGARYCAMRMLWMKECYEKPRKKKPRYLDFKEYTFKDSMLKFINHYTDFLKEVYSSIRNRLLLITVVLIIVAFCLMTFLVHINPWISLLVSLVLCGLNYWIQIRKMPEMFQKNQTNFIEKYVDEVLVEFDRSYRML